LTERLRDLLAPALEKLGYELIQVEQVATRRPVLRLYIDRLGEDGGGVTLDDCQKVSEYASGLLDVEDPLPGAYSLEVSSPGLDRPLKRPADYERFAGHEVNITLKLPFKGRKNYRGRLTAADEGWRLALGGEQAEQALDFRIEEVREARLVPVLDFKGRARKTPEGPRDGGADGGQTR
jgi:ribosome maturation factor RimP